MLRKASLESDLIFPNTKLLRKALRQYSVQKKFDFNYLHNDKIWVHAQCSIKDCTFYMFTLRLRDSDSIQIKVLISQQMYGAHYKTKKCDVEFLAKHYLPNFRDCSTWPPATLKEQIRQEFNIYVSLHHCYRAKKMACEKVFGN